MVVNSSDCDEQPYNFDVQGKGATPASALDFDGVNDYVEVPYNAALNITGNVTLEAWVKTSTSTEQYIISRANSGYLLAVNPANAFPGKAAFWVHGPSSAWLCSNTNIADGNWHHVAGVRNGTTVQIFIDGVLDATGTVGSGNIPTSTDPLGIGRRSTFPTSLLNGSADEVRIWNTARTPATKSINCATAN